jgi:dihydrofolate reductase
MGKVFTHMTMSLDGFIADPNDQVGELFDWYEAGDVTVPNPNEQVSFKVDDASAEALRELTANTGALVSGRRLFDIADGWGDNHPAGAPVVVVTHRVPDDAGRWPRTTFVEGVDTAITRAREIAGDKNITIASANVAQQALALGLVDEVCVSLVPVLFGEGIPYFAKLNGGHQLLDDPVVIQGRRALHLRYPVRRSAT